MIVLGPVEGGATAILNGIPKRMLRDGTDSGGPIPWEKTALTPNLGLIDHAADIRGGLGFQGLANLKQFVARRRAAHCGRDQFAATDAIRICVGG